MRTAPGSAGARSVAIGFTLLFFAFLFGPLVIMTITAFNSSSFPRITPWECFTTNWFRVLLADTRLLAGLGNSLIIGAGVVAIATPLGLAAALALTEVGARLRATLYTVFITPILVPGVVLGISTIVFWGSMGRAVGASYTSIFHDGTFLTIIGQVSFIAAYTMLIFIARLQRFDPTLTEAALDMGATPGQAFRKILVPYLRPAIASAAVLALLASLENYNTTVFTIMAGNTFTTVLASKVRFGINPSLSALAVIIIAITLIGAVVHEAYTRRQEALLTGRTAALSTTHPALSWLLHPLAIGAALLAVAGLLFWLGSRQDSTACEQGIIDEKRAVQERLLEEQRRRMQAPSQQNPASAPAAPATPNPSPFGGAFNPGTLRPASPAPAAPEPAAPAPPAPTQNPSPFGGAFSPGALRPSSPP